MVTLTPIQKVWLISLKGREEACGKVAHFLTGLGVCPRCIFRLLKIKDVKFYREDLQVRPYFPNGAPDRSVWPCFALTDQSLPLLVPGEHVLPSRPAILIAQGSYDP